MDACKTLKKWIWICAAAAMILAFAISVSAADNTPGAFQVVKGKRYFISESTGKKMTGWIVWQGGRYYLNPKTGEVMTGKQTISQKLYYLNPTSKIPGRAFTGWRNIKGKKYYFDKKTGAAKRGWFTDQGKTYYFTADFSMRKGWQSYKGKQYFFDRTTGENRTGFVKDGNNTYYCSPAERYRVTGWQTIDGKRYYFSNKGIMQTGLCTIGGKRYIFSSKGVLVTKKTAYTYRRIRYIIGEDGTVTYKDQVAKEAAKRLDIIGWNLRKAFTWASNLTYRSIDDTVPAGRKPSEYFASYGLRNHAGDCHVKASTFYYLALLLGYDAYYIQGQIPYTSLGGELGDHGWVEIVKDGKTYLCDPSYSGGTGIDTLMITYQKANWHYCNYKRVE